MHPAERARVTGHLWLPYSQMKTALPPLRAASTRGSRITLADGRVLIDGVASWWTACHGYNHPHIADAVTRQLARMPHVMFGGLTHEPAQRLAARLAARRPGALARGFVSASGAGAGGPFLPSGYGRLWPVVRRYLGPPSQHQRSAHRGGEVPGRPA